MGRHRAQSLVDRFEHHIDEGERVLDIGPGGGWISETVAHRKDAKPTLVDVTDFGFTEMPVDLYDGQTLPYPDAHFDIVLLIFTLHHCSEPLAVLDEAVRVCRRRLIIIEDTPHSRLSHLYAVLWDTISNAPTFLIPPGMNMTFHFKQREEWRRLFSDRQLQLIEEQPLNQHGVLHKTLFVVDKAQSPAKGDAG